MSLTISGLNQKRFEADPDYRSSVLNNIKSGWIFICVPEESQIADFKKSGDTILVTIQQSGQFETIRIPAKPGIYKF